MAKQWNYDVDLPANMTHTMQVQSDSPDADFNLYVIDPDGSVVAKDDGPESGAECTLTTKASGRYILRIELKSGNAGFSMNVSSKTAQQEPLESQSKQSTGGESLVTAGEAERLLVAHNQWRDRYECPPLGWSEDLAAFAQDWANQLAENGMQMKHRSPNSYGENLFWCSGKRATPQEVVDAWGSEVEFYDESQNNWWPKAGHFSQVIWHNTTHVGGAVVRANGQEIWVCNYNPRGNWTGQRPYKTNEN